MRASRRPIGSICGLWLIGAIALGPVALAGNLSLETTLDEPTRWVTLESPFIARGHGSGFRLERLPAGATLRVVETGRRIDDAVLFAGRLYLAGPDGIEVRTVSAPDAPVHRIPLRGVSAGPVRITVVVDHVVVGTSDGLIVFEPPLERGHHEGEHRRIDRIPRRVGELSTDLPVGDLAGDGTAVWAAVGAELVRVDLRDPGRPTIDRRVSLDRPATAVAANGGRVYWSDGERLRVDDLAEDGGVDSIALEGGISVELAGRDIYVATGPGGLQRVADTSRRSALIDVTLSGFSFTPSVVSVFQGDTVRWTNAGGLHNVESCDGVSDPVQCSSTANENFLSGGPSSAAFVFDHTFQSVGTNPYFCVVHVGLGMTGVVEVTAAASNPPAVPDGTVGDPLRASRLDSTGTTLGLLWDVTTCSDFNDHQVIFGFGADLPAAAGGAFSIAGSACTIGNAGSFTWANVPSAAADPDGLLWFLLLTTDGATTEGSWGLDGGGLERDSSALDGNSGQCGVVAKDATNVCGQ